MIVSCPSCGKPNPPWARRCARCGSTLDDESEQAPLAGSDDPPARARAAEPGAERPSPAPPRPGAPLRQDAAGSAWKSAPPKPFGEAKPLRDLPADEPAPILKAPVVTIPPDVTTPPDVSSPPVIRTPPFASTSPVVTLPPVRQPFPKPHSRPQQASSPVAARPADTPAVAARSEDRPEDRPEDRSKDRPEDRPEDRREDRREALPGEDWFGNAPPPEPFDRLEPQSKVPEPRLGNPDLLLDSPDPVKTAPGREPRLSPSTERSTFRGTEAGPLPLRGNVPPAVVQTRPAPLEALEPPPRVEPRLPETDGERKRQPAEAAGKQDAQIAHARSEVELGIRADRPGAKGTELEGLDLFGPPPLAPPAKRPAAAPTANPHEDVLSFAPRADEEPAWHDLDADRRDSADERRQPGSNRRNQSPGSTLGEQVGRSRASPKVAGGSRRVWLVALLILLVLLCGTAALVAVRLTAPDAPEGSLTVQELSDRARNRLQQWGLLPP